MKPVNPNEFSSLTKLKRGGSVLALGLGLAVLLPIAAQAQYYGRGYGPYVVPPYGGYGGGGRYVVPPDGGGPYEGPYGGPYGGPPPYGPYDAGPGGPPPGPMPAYGGAPGGDDEYDAPPRRPGPRPSPYSGPPPSNGPSVQRGGGVGPVSADMIQGRIKAAGYRLIAPPRHKGNIYLAEVEDTKSIRHRLVYDANDGHLLENTPLGPAKKPGGPLPSEQSREPRGPEPTQMGAPAGNEPANQATASPPAAAHMDEPPPPPPSGEGK